ncbi:biosynthetic-type acetolactate synthase large subunit [Embleya sp. NPDC127516]|uniref:biosynthetic-type acetolactate synthase large subunit n=1 Tax=Embleya sp. NPDC127516 TaxID=3363990 RepID=UPI003811052D
MPARDLRNEPLGDLPADGTVRLTGAQILLYTLRLHAVDTVFGIPGEAVMPLYQRIASAPGLHHVLVRHEQGAGHAASGYAQATGRIGVCLGTSGPGSTNLVTPLLDAHMDSVPILAIAGQVVSHLIGTDAFQEADICAITAPITKYNAQVTKTSDIFETVDKALRIAVSGRPGPALVAITKDALDDSIEVPMPLEVPTTGPADPPTPDPARIDQAVQALLNAERPVLYVGGGVIKSGGSPALLRLAELTGAPVVTTLMARGAFPDGNRRHLGMPGRHGSVTAVGAMQKADLLVALGARFDNRVTGEIDSFAPHATVVHVDIDPAEISRKRRADVPILADCAQALSLLADAVQRALDQGRSTNYRSWWDTLEEWRRRYPPGYAVSPDALAPQYVIERLGTLTAGPRSVYTAGVGQHQMWAAQFIRFERPRTWINSGGAGTMGYAIPAALGVQAALPEAIVWAIDGDGSFQMTNQELATCVLNHLPIKVAVINNASLGMVRQAQNMTHGEEHANIDLDSDSAPISPDITRLAEAYGCRAFRCDRAQDVDATIEAAMTIEDVPVVVDFVVAQEAMVWPMVPSGVSNDDILEARDRRPDFGQDGTP